MSSNPDYNKARTNYLAYILKKGKCSTAQHLSPILCSCKMCINFCSDENWKDWLELPEKVVDKKTQQP